VTGVPEKAIFRSLTVYNKNLNDESEYQNVHSYIKDKHINIS